MRLSGIDRFRHRRLHTSQCHGLAYLAVPSHSVVTIAQAQPLSPAVTRHCANAWLDAELELSATAQPRPGAPPFESIATAEHWLL